LDTYITVRDIKNNIMYEGILVKFANKKGKHEMLLGNVTVYENEEGKEVYSVDRLYLNTDFDEVTLEVREYGKEDNNE
jgi:hypothetical protein